MKKGKQSVGPIIAIVVGIIILIKPEFLAWVLGLYLIIRGALDLIS